MLDLFALNVHSQESSIFLQCFEKQYHSFGVCFMENGSHFCFGLYLSFEYAQSFSVLYA